MSFKRWKLQWQRKNKEHLSKYRKEYYRKNRTRIALARIESRKRYYLKHRQQEILRSRKNRKRKKAQKLAAQKREETLKLQGKCISCESILKGNQRMCEWCVMTYQEGGRKYEYAMNNY